jgi:hypothetical protein
VDWINLVKEAGKWVAAVNKVMNLLDVLIQGKQLDYLMNCDFHTHRTSLHVYKGAGH